MDTSGQGQHDQARASVGTISRPNVRPATGARVRPEPVPVPAADPAPRRARRRPPEPVPQPRNAVVVPAADPAQRRDRRVPLAAGPREGMLPAAPAAPRNARTAPAPVPGRTPPPPRRPPASPRTIAPQVLPWPAPAAPAPPAQAAPAPLAQAPLAPSPAAPPRAVPPRAVPPQAVPLTGAPSRARPRSAASASHRMPFVLLLCGLLGGALISALVISTTLAEGSFRITRLQQSTNALARQRQALEEQVASARSAQVIEKRALKLGMRPAGVLRFIDLKTGKTSSDQGTGYVRSINVPGFTP